MFDTTLEQSIGVPTPHQRWKPMPLEITTLVAFVHTSKIISHQRRETIFHSYKYRHGSVSFSLPIALCLPLLVAIYISHSSQKYRTNPRMDYKYIIIIINLSSIFISLVYEFILIYIVFINYNKGELRCLKYQNK